MYVLINVSGLVFGRRMIASEEVMNEIFGEEEMEIFYRVEMEMGLADKEKARKLAEQRLPLTGIIRLDDDYDMEDASRIVMRGGSTTGLLQGKCIHNT